MKVLFLHFQFEQTSERKPNEVLCVQKKKKKLEIERIHDNHTLTYDQGIAGAISTFAFSVQITNNFQISQLQQIPDIVVSAKGIFDSLLHLNMWIWSNS